MTVTENKRKQAIKMFMSKRLTKLINYKKGLAVNKNKNTIFTLISARDAIAHAIVDRRPAVLM